MLCSVTSNCVDCSIITGQWNIESNDRVAAFDQVVHVWAYISFRCGSGQELSNLIQESSFSAIGRCAEVSAVDEFYNDLKKEWLRGMFSALTLYSSNLTVHKFIFGDESVIHPH